MTKNFWANLTKPFTVMAPMDDVTDDVFRQVILSEARPDVFFTEFANIDGLVHGANGIPLRKLKFTPNQHPIVAQVWGTDFINMEKAASMVADLGFDGIDINMGCPVRDVVKKGGGSGLIGNYDLVEKLIDAAKKGASGIPLSVKTRLGINKNIAEEWITFLLGKGLAALTIHGRIASQMSKGEADWEEIGKAVKIKNKIAPETIIIGNGDVKSFGEVTIKMEKYGVDGVMIGRGVFINPWVFSKDLNTPIHSKEDHIKMLLTHIDLFEKTWGKTKNFSIIKKFFKMYINNFKGANQLRIELMDAENFSKVKEILSKW
jgi:nifR3 family TIM-barrel protein